MVNVTLTDRAAFSAQRDRSSAGETRVDRMTPHSPSGSPLPSPSNAIADLPEFISMAREKGLDPRPVILRVQTDLLIAAPERTPDMLGNFSRLALELIPLIEDETLAQIAGKLARLPELPHGVAAALLARQGLVAAAFIANAPALPAEAALVLADQGDLLCARALAGRSDGDATLLLRLLDRDDADIDLRIALAVPHPLPGAAIDRLLARAPGRVELCSALIGRQDVTVEDGARLLPWLRSADRVALIGRAHAPQAMAPAHHPPSPDIADDLDIETLVLLARRRDEDLFRSELARLLNLPTTSIELIASDDGGELLVLALVTIGCFPEEIAAILLSRQPALSHDARQVLALVDQARHLRRDVALRLLTGAFMPEAVRSARGAALAPQFAGEARPTLRAILRPARQKAGAARSDIGDVRHIGEAG
jgi:uncharacterized protein (DUF2336 family)